MAELKISKPGLNNLVDYIDGRIAVLQQAMENCQTVDDFRKYQGSLQELRKLKALAEYQKDH